MPKSAAIAGVREDRCEGDWVSHRKRGGTQQAAEVGGARQRRVHRRSYARCWTRKGHVPPA